MGALHEPVPDELASGPEDGTPRPTGPGKAAQALVVAALVAGATLFGPDLLASSRHSPRPDAGRPPPPVAATSPSSAARPYTRPAALDWPVRGDLARDRSLVADVLDYAGRDGPRAAEVLFVGRLPDGGRLALVGIDDPGARDSADGGLEIRALHLRPGQDVQDGRFESTGELADADGVVGWAGRGTKGRFFAVILARPAPLEAEISQFIEYEPTGAAHRKWRPFTGRDGAAVLDLGTRSDQIVAVRPLFDHPKAFPLVVTVDRDAEVSKRMAFAFGPHDIAGVREPTYAGPPPVSLAFAIAEVTRSIFDPAEADVRAIWSGRLDRSHRAALVRARLPDGPTFHLFIAVDDVTGGYSASVRRVPWATADVTPWLLVPPEAGKPVLLVNPSGPGTAMIEYDGQPPRTVAIERSGLAELATDQFAAYNVYGASVTVRAPDGRRIVRSTLTHPRDDDIFVLR